MRSSLHVVDHTRPLMVLKFPATVDADVIHAMMAAFDRALRRGQRFATVLDGTDIAKLPRAEERQTLTDWMRDATRLGQERALSVATAIVVPSGLVRAFVAAINFVQKPVTPQQWTATLPEALDWACERLVAAGVALTPEIERYREESRPAAAPRRKP